MSERRRFAGVVMLYGGGVRAWVNWRDGLRGILSVVGKRKKAARHEASQHRVKQRHYAVPMNRNLWMAIPLLLGLWGCAATRPTEPLPGPRSAVAQRVMAEISHERVRADIERLVAFGTRHTLSDTTSDTRGIGAAQRWVKGELEKAAATSGGRMSVTLEEFDAPKSERLPEGGHLANVVATLSGTDPIARERTYYVVAHLDSRNEDVMDAVGEAPGANDDGSGTVAVLEIARALAKEELRATVVFLLTTGEEQGLIGATHHANAAKARGEKIGGVLSNDIIGGVSERGERRGEIRLFSEGVPRNPSKEEYARVRSLALENDSPSRELARFAVEVAALERTTMRPVMMYRPDRFLRGGDHSAFNDAGFAAVRFTEFDENYEHQHANVTQTTDAQGRVVRHGDLPEYVDATGLADAARLNAAVLVHLANAPAGPGNVRLITAKLSRDTEVRWERSAGATGYEVVTRATTSAVWERAMDVGDVTSATLPMSKDDMLVGVRAYGKDGYRSAVACAGAAKE